MENKINRLVKESRKEIILKVLILVIIGVISIFLVKGAVAQVFGNAGSPNFNNPNVGGWQSVQPSFNTYYPKKSTKGGQIGIYDMWPILRDIENEQCDATSDFLISIRPGSCRPAVVRSDLLEEQNVPVFCQLDAIRVNPLIKVSYIKSISFKGKYPEGVAGISFHPARAAVRSYRTLLGSPLLNNIGYVVIILKQTKAEKEMPDWISGNLTAIIYYDADNVYGTGRGEYYLYVMSDEDWERDYKNFGFWYGRGYLRVKDVEDGYARIAVYTDKENIFREVVLREGQTSKVMYFPGFYCRAGLKIRLNKIVSPEKQALLNIDGQKIWVREGSRILGNCKVKRIGALSDGTGSIYIHCPRQKINLVLQGPKALISVDGIKNEYQVGEQVFLGNSTKWYLGYVGNTPKNVKGVGEKVAVIVGSSKKISDEEIGKIFEKISEIEQDSKDFSIEDFEKKLGASFGIFKKIKLKVLPSNNSITYNSIIDGKKIIFEGVAEKDDEKEYEQILEENFEKANQTVMRLVEEFGEERDLLGRYGERALLEQARLAEELGKFKTAKNLYKKFIERYPDSKNIEGVRERLARLGAYDFSKAYASVLVNNNYHSIKVENFKPVSKREKNALIGINGKINISYEGTILFENSTDKISVKEIDTDGVTLVYHHRKNTLSSWDSKTQRPLKEKDSINLIGKEIVIHEINVEKIAYVSLIPEIKHTKTEANFSFKIGIEKRAIKLSPEKTRERIKNLNKTIADLERANERLGNLIKGWKGACFATSSLLMLKNLASGFSGESIARQMIMKKYRAECDLKHPEMSHTECYNLYSAQINKDVKILHKIIIETNKHIEKFERMYLENKGVLGLESVVNTKKALEKYRESYRERYGDKVTIFVDGKERKVDISDLNFEQLREAEVVARLKNSDASDIAKKSVQESLDRKLELVWRVQEARRKEKELREKYSIKDGNKIVNIEVSVLPVGQSTLFYNKKCEMPVSQLKNIVLNNDNEDFVEALEKVKGETIGVRIVGVGTTQYLVLMQPPTKKQGPVQQIGIFEVSQSGNKLVVGEKRNSLPVATGVEIVNVGGGECKNKYLNPKVKYYETGNEVRLPAIVPFDIENGWYVKIPQAVGGLFSTQKKGYTASGDVSFFYICNVGPNGLEENGKYPDICQSFDVNTYDRVNQFIGCPNLSPQEVQQLISKARQAIREASQQYKKSGYVNIGGTQIEVAPPVRGDGELIECQDFMSPEDCLLLFNVCDPVICPPSRCNLGGKWPVANVAQEGIIGSLVLCLPNAKEGVIVPICLTGVHAGIESLVSILKAGRECLEHNLKTGEHIGICDEITSIYLCEFLWRQLAPMIDVLIPKIVESAYGLQAARGGGEYLTVMHAWDTMQKSIDYFKNEYAQNAFRAFKFRNVQEAGGTFCKMFIGVSLPSSASFIDNLLEPESPEQVYAWFSEVPYSDATVPATSFYKVYYHIYAGKDRGAYYSVYLRNPPATSYYAINPIVHIKTGYIPKGEHVDRTIEFTAPSGYKELCVVINTQTHCGFKQVTTDFALNYLSKKYVEEQAEKRQITTTEECISGSPSILSFVRPNIQEGVEEFVNPQIAMRGIVRVCATHNPGQYTNNQSRWKEVGYCDDPNIKCWLDTESVKRDVEQIRQIEGTLEKTEEYMEKMEEGILTPEETRAKLSVLREKIRKLRGITKENVDEKIGKLIDELSILIEGKGGEEGVKGRAYSNTDIAEALSLKASVYQTVVRQLKPVVSRSEIIENSKKDKSKKKTESDEKKGESIEGEEKIEWKDEMLEENVVIIVKNFWLGRERKYKYNSNQGWICDNCRWLKNVGYVEGIKKIVKKTTSFGGYVIVKGEKIPNYGNSDEEMAEKIFNKLKKSTKKKTTRVVWV